MPNYTLRERLYSRLVPDPETGCLLWTGHIAENGYGKTSIGSRTDGTRRTQYVHIIAWELDNGPVPPGLTLDHVKARGCRYRHCANVTHLEPVTMRENLMRGNTPSAVNAAKTHCDSGHEFTEANTRVDRTGWRACRACAAVRAREARATP
jgi:hypothetical protein